MTLMMGMTAGKGVEGGGCGGSAGDVCTRVDGMPVGTEADGDTHCREGTKGNRKYHGRLIPLWRALGHTMKLLPATKTHSPVIIQMLRRNWVESTDTNVSFAGEGDESFFGDFYLWKWRVWRM
jgi:hypothetical protein